MVLVLEPVLALQGRVRSRQHSIEGRGEQIQTAFSGRKAFQLAFAVEQIVSRNIPLIVLKASRNLCRLSMAHGSVMP